MAVKTIAIIEDDEHIGNILETCLRQEGYRTIRAYSGTEARYLLADKRGGGRSVGMPTGGSGFF